jgi:hypothetical protein
MLKDLSALTPPILMAAAFLIAAGAFLRHEMRGGRNRTEDDAGADSGTDVMSDREINPADEGTIRRAPADKPDESSQD